MMRGAIRDDSRYCARTPQRDLQRDLQCPQRDPQCPQRDPQRDQWRGQSQGKTDVTAVEKRVREPVSPQIGFSPLAKEGIMSATLVESAGIYHEGGSRGNGMEVNINMVEAFDKLDLNGPAAEKQGRSLDSSMSMVAAYDDWIVDDQEKTGREKGKEPAPPDGGNAARHLPAERMDPAGHRKTQRTASPSAMGGSTRQTVSDRGTGGDTGRDTSKQVEGSTRRMLSPASRYGKRKEWMCEDVGLGMWDSHIS